MHTQTCVYIIIILMIPYTSIYTTRLNGWMQVGSSACCFVLLLLHLLLICGSQKWWCSNRGVAWRIKNIWALYTHQSSLSFNTRLTDENTWVAWGNSGNPSGPNVRNCSKFHVGRSIGRSTLGEGWIEKQLRTKLLLSETLLSETTRN